LVFDLNLSFLSSSKNICLLINLDNLLMKRVISSGSYLVLSSLLSSSFSSLELSSTTFLLLLFFVALKAMCYFFEEMIPLDKFLTCWASSGSYSVLSSLLSSSFSSLELSSTTFLLLLFFVALKAMRYFFEEMIPLDKFLTCWTSSTSISLLMILPSTSSRIIFLKV
jgi:hypothetical protein